MSNIVFKQDSDTFEVWGGVFLLSRETTKSRAKWAAVDSLREKIADLFIYDADDLSLGERAVQAEKWAVLVRELFEVGE